MLDPKLVANSPITAVNALDIQRLWSMQSQHPTSGGVSISVEVIRQICDSEAADPIAVWARTGLVSLLLQTGVLEAWRTNDGLRKEVFEAAAVFPLPNGLQGLDASDFVATLPG